MAIRDIFKVSRKTFINPAGWIDYEGLKTQNRTIITVIKSLYTPQKAERSETFEQAMTRLQITDADVQSLASRYSLFALMFALLGIAVFGYAFYLLFAHVSFLGFILGLSVSGLFFAYGFKYDFWALQMKRRELGLTFEEWKHHILGK